MVVIFGFIALRIVYKARALNRLQDTNIWNVMNDKRQKKNAECHHKDMICQAYELKVGLVGGLKHCNYLYPSVKEDCFSDPIFLWIDYF